MLRKTEIGIYGNGVFQETEFAGFQVEYDEQLELLAASSFTYIVLWAFHVQPDGSIHYNGVPVTQGGEVFLGGGLNQRLPDLLDQLRAQGQIRRVGISLGGDQSTFEDHIMPNLGVVIAGIQSLAEFLGLDLIDFDFEPDKYTEKHRDTIVAVTEAVSDLGLAVPYCPYNGSWWWPGTLAAVNAKIGRQPVTGMNLQLYGEEPDAAQTWVQELESTEGTGIHDLASFVVPGYAVQSTAEQHLGQCPGSIESTFAQLTPVELTSGWLWNAG